VIDLIFDRPAPASTSLVFGDELTVPRVDLTVTGALPGLSASVQVLPHVLANLTGVLPKLSASIRLAPTARLSVFGTLPGITARITASTAQPVVLTGVFAGLQMAAEIAYHTNTQRPTIANLHTFVQVARPVESGIKQPEQQAQQSTSGVQSVMSDASHADSGFASGFANAADTTYAFGSGFQDAEPVHDSTHAAMQDGDVQWLRFISKFQEADRLAAARLTGQFEDGLHDRRISRTARWQEAHRRDALRYRGHAGPARPFVHGSGSRFQDAQVPPAGITTWPTPPVVPPPYWGTVLLFQCPPLAYPSLVFGVQPCYPVTPGAPFQILPARFYMTTHSIYAQRLPDLADIPIFSATVSADSGSYCWSLSASGPASLFELLAPIDGLPAQLRLTLDGMPWVFAIDRISRSARFGQTSVSVQGRSVTALIAAPYLRSESRVESDDKTAQQLALINLTNTGVSLDWGTGAGALANAGLIDWFVPAGAYSRQGTALEAVSRIVQAAGGYLQSHRSDPVLLARHPYGQRTGDVSGAPWDWGTGSADIELAPDALITESVQRQDGPDINAVYVSGTTHGVLALVRRSGTAADKLASMVTDSLITHADAARQAGLAILGAAGHKYAVTLDLPVLTGAGQPGVIDVGQLVQVNAATPWRGRVRGVSVSAKQPSLRQTITLERHIA
jgi:hypothetical protein